MNSSPGEGAGAYKLIGLKLRRVFRGASLVIQYDCRFLDSALDSFNLARNDRGGDLTRKPVEDDRPPAITIFLSGSFCTWT